MYHLKHRPSVFDEFIGSDALVNSILDGLDNHVFMFIGDYGCGKTTLAYLLAKEVGATNDSITEINAGQFRGIDTARELTEIIKLKRYDGKKRVIIIDEFQGTTVDCQRALLTVLEKCPPDVYFIFCTTDPQKILAPLKSRCAVYSVRRLSPSEAGELFDSVCRAEKIEFSAEARKAIIDHAEGVPRQLLMNMYVCRNASDAEVVSLLQGITSGATAEAIEVCRMFLNPKKLRWADLMAKVDLLLKQESAESLRRMFFAYFCSVLKGVKNNNEVMFYTALLDCIEKPLEENKNGTHGFIHMLGKIASGVLNDG
jgi:DNA polymerase III delta prime subunit